jgi:hypothetical protein
VTDRLLELQRALASAGDRLGALAERVTRLRGLELAVAVDHDGAGHGAGHDASLPPSAGTPLPFGGLDARPIDDLELTFEAVDVDGGALDRDKVR